MITRHTCGQQVVLQGAHNCTVSLISETPMEKLLPRRPDRHLRRVSSGLHGCMGTERRSISSVHVTAKCKSELNTIEREVNGPKAPPATSSDGTSRAKVTKSLRDLRESFSSDHRRSDTSSSGKRAD